ncbi:hypothetical protein [Nocardia brasiliensis]|uniref:hypothetical protein n=1 Tax=Nocardia brasiliensis TaxID=37326 RepID=UPI0024545AA2|nr:hypothetical protein [Nocardia brasiliensis]
MFSVALRNPAMAGVLVFAAVAVVPVALVLTTDREPTATVQHAPVRPDGCVMFCTPTPQVELKAATRPTTPKEKCVMFCDSPPPEMPTQECWLLCAQPYPRAKGGARR